ncbi:hypothetical protein PG996_002776 [Apiospora saccharicola]|uniref:Secreted protein n=1 Tax=Apiospora saccharicola TaxID=335842 RepID=A0ABR1WKC7_9PEZI
MHIATVLFLLGSLARDAFASTLSPVAPRGSVLTQPETRPKVSRLKFWGSGCSQASQAHGSVDVVAADYEHVTARFRDFAAWIGPGTNVTDRSTFCQMSMQFEGAEPGWQVALDSAAFRGHLTITPPVTMHTWMISFFVEDAAKTTQSTTKTEPASTSDGDVTTSFEIPESKSVWSLCSDRSGYTGVIDVNYRVAFTTKELPGTGSYGKTGRGAVTESLYFKWRRCE